MANIIFREKAQTLRREGLSIKEIVDKLKINKSTVSYWCRDIQLTPLQFKRLQEKQKTAGLKAIMANSERLRKKRIEETNQMSAAGIKDVGKVNTRDLFILGVGLYWAEGYKRGNEEFGFTNSDPLMIEVILKWLFTIYKIKSEDFILRISINKVHRDRESEIKKYWSTVTGAKQTQFTKTAFIKTRVNKIYKNRGIYYGILRVKIRRGANVRRRILGSILGLSKNNF